MRNFVRLILPVVISVTHLVASAAGQVSLRDRIGWNEANERLGREMPTGAGIAFGHVEGNAGEYRPDLTGPAYDAVAFSLRSGDSEPSAHATATAKIIYGSRGLAPGVEVVHVMTSQDFLTDALLRSNTTAPPMSAEEEPTPFPARVYTHSWIGDPPEAQALPILRRVDWLVDERDLIMVVGVNNGRESTVPALLGSAYNAIAVGQLQGNSSGGLTRVEVPGRVKPDLVAPGNLTSFHDAGGGGGGGAGVAVRRPQGGGRCRGREPVGGGEGGAARRGREAAEVAGDGGPPAGRAPRRGGW